MRCMANRARTLHRGSGTGWRRSEHTIWAKVPTPPASCHGHSPHPLRPHRDHHATRPRRSCPRPLSVAPEPQHHRPRVFLHGPRIRRLMRRGCDPFSRGAARRWKRTGMTLPCSNVEPTFVHSGFREAPLGRGSSGVGVRDRQPAPASAGTCGRLFPGGRTGLSGLQSLTNAEGAITWDLSVDSTVCRAHRHAAGVRKRGNLQKVPPGGTFCRLSQYPCEQRHVYWVLGRMDRQDVRLFARTGRLGHRFCDETRWGLFGWSAGCAATVSPSAPVVWCSGMTTKEAFP